MKPAARRSGPGKRPIERLELALAAVVLRAAIGALRLASRGPRS